MAIVSAEKFVQAARDNGYAVGGFNTNNLEWTQAILRAAEAKKASVPVCLHLDHGSSFELAMQAMHAGYTSVMLNIWAVTKYVNFSSKTL